MAQTLKRGLFGYRASNVKQVLADREQMFERVCEDVRQAQARIEELGPELATVRTELETSRTELETSRAEAETLRTEFEATRAETEAALTELDGSQAELRVVRNERDATRTELAERERALEVATARVTSLQGELEATIERLEQSRDAELQTEPHAPAVAGSGELDQVLRRTETTIHRIVQEARRGAEQELAQIERRRDAVRAEVEALLARRDRLAPLARNVRELLGEAQSRAEEADTRLRSALEPLTRTVDVLRGRLSELIDEAGREDEPSVEVAEEGPEEGSTLIHLADGPRAARSSW
jgi:chromosome segregation ATPase